MRLFLDPDNQEKPRLELIPMIDVMFFLMVVFIFLSISLIKLDGVNLDLPKASASRLMPGGTVIHLSLLRDGTIFLEKKKVRQNELETFLRQKAKGITLKVCPENMNVLSPLLTC